MGPDPDSRWNFVLEGPAGPVAQLAFAKSWGGSEATAAVFSLSMMGQGALALAGGAQCKMSSHGWLHHTWEFSGGGGAAVEVLSASVDAEALSLLTLPNAQDCNSRWDPSPWPILPRVLPARRSLDIRAHADGK